MTLKPLPIASRLRQVLRPIWLLAYLSVMVSCGGADQSTQQTPPSATDTPAAANAERFESTAPALPTPPAATTPPPSDRSLPGAAPSHPPRLAATLGSRLALASDLGSGVANPSVVRQVVIGSLELPFDMALAVDGSLFFTERRKGLSVLREGQPPIKLFAPADLEASAAGGMRGVAVDPQFTVNRHVYVFMRSRAEGRLASRVARLTLDATLGRVTERRDIVVIADSQGSSAGTANAATPSGAGSTPTGPHEQHIGGALRFGPDGHLYVALGDGRHPLAAQAPTLLQGKVLKVDRDGAPAGHRAPVGHDPRVYAVGLREPVALGFHPASQALLAAQRRGTQADEIVLLKAGANAGWDARCAAPGSGYCEPAHPAVGSQWRAAAPAGGVAAIELLRGEAWRAWRNSFVVAHESAQRLELVLFESDGRVGRAAVALKGMGFGFGALAQSGAALFVATRGKPGGDEIWRLTLY